MSTSDGRRQAWVEWISVEDRLPPSGQTVLAYAPGAGAGGRRMRACYVEAFSIEIDVDAGYEGDEGPDGTWWAPAGWYEDTIYGDYQPQVYDEVTHWMALPPAPEAA